MMGPGWRYLKTRLIISMIKLVALDWNGVLIADAAHAAAGASKVLDFLFKRSVEMIVISNHTIEGVNFQKERLGLQKYFSNVFARDAKGSWASRSKLERLQKFLGQRSFLPKEIVIIGDSPEEVEVGKHLGIHTIAITGGFCSARRLKDARPDYLIHNLTEMIEVVKKL